jgi:hypothetical protein
MAGETAYPTSRHQLHQDIRTLENQNSSFIDIWS